MLTGTNLVGYALSNKFRVVSGVRVAVAKSLSHLESDLTIMGGETEHWEGGDGCDDAHERGGSATVLGHAGCHVGVH